MDSSIKPVLFILLIIPPFLSTQPRSMFQFFHSFQPNPDPVSILLFLSTQPWSCFNLLFLSTQPRSYFNSSISLNPTLILFPFFHSSRPNPNHWILTFLSTQLWYPVSIVLFLSIQPWACFNSSLHLNPTLKSCFNCSIPLNPTLILFQFFHSSQSNPDILFQLFYSSQPNPDPCFNYSISLNLSLIHVFILPFLSTQPWSCFNSSISLNPT